MTPAQRKFLAEAACNWLGVAKLSGTTGFGRRQKRLMAFRLCDAGLMEKYHHGSDEYRITDAGRAILSESAK